MIDLYTWPTPNGHKIHIMLEETGLEYRVHPIDIGAGDQFKPEFLAIAPNNRMPAIVDDEPVDGGAPVSVFESGAILVFWRLYGATPGKIAVALKIVDAETGKPPSTGRLVVRLLCYLLSALPLYLGFIWVAIDRRKQGWHDKIAGTVVVQETD